MENVLDATISTGEVNVEILPSSQDNEAISNKTPEIVDESTPPPAASYSQDIPAEAFKNEEEAAIDSRPLNVRIIDKVKHKRYLLIFTR